SSRRRHTRFSRDWSSDVCSSDLNKYLRLFWTLFVGGVGFVVLIFALANFGVFGDMPTFDELENPNSSLATEIISADGKTIGKFRSEERRVGKECRSLRWPCE